MRGYPNRRIIKGEENQRDVEPDSPEGLRMSWEDNQIGV
jgi:hypothetical protein